MCVYICTSVYAHFHVWAQVCVHACVRMCVCVPVCTVYIHTWGGQRTILGFILQVLPVFETVFLTGLELHQVN